MTQVISQSKKVQEQIALRLQQANALLAQGQVMHAGPIYQSVLQLAPNNLDALEQMGLAAYKTKQSELAGRCWQKVIQLDPKRVRSLYMFAMLNAEQGDVAAAIALYQRVTKLAPAQIEAFNNLGVLLKNQERYEEAAAAFRQVVKKKPKSAFALSNLGNVLKESGHLNEAITSLERANKADPKMSAAYSNLLLALHYQDHCPKALFERHQSWGEHVPEHIKADRFDFSARPSLQDKLTNKQRISIGFVSPDLHRHSVAFFIESLFAHYDKGVFEFVVYHNNRKHDAVSERLKSMVDAWHVVVDLDELALAERIYQDQVDILIDLAGHTANNRLAVFYQKPAPVQMTWLGYPNSTGLQQIDYRICDAQTDPETYADDIHSEKLLRLDRPFLCYQAPDEAVACATKTPALDKGYITFASFNNLVKISDATLECWSALLNSAPNSRLLIKAMQLGNEAMRARLLARFEQAGIDPSRLDLHAMVPDYAGHLALYNQVDIALDTLPYNGTTTTCEALYMGVPVLTLEGDSHVSRVSSSLLNNLGLNDFVCKDIAQALALVDRFVAQPEQLNHVRKGLRKRMLQSPLCDGKGFAQRFEQAILSL